MTDAPVPLPTLYTRLLDATDRVLRNTQFRRELEDELEELCERVEQELGKPAETRLIFDEEHLLAGTLLRIERTRRFKEYERMRLWQQIAGVLLPHVKEHFGKALEARRNTAPATTDQDYHRGRHGR